MRRLRQPLCSTSPPLASNYISGHFHLIPARGAVGGISVISRSFESFCGALRKCCLSPCGRTRPPRQSRAERRASTQRWRVPAHPLLSPAPPRLCGWTGAGMLTDAAAASVPQEPSVLPASAFQSGVPSTAAEAHCAGPLLKPPGLLVIEYLFELPFDYLSENKTP